MTSDHPACALCGSDCGPQTEFDPVEFYKLGEPAGLYWSVCSGCDDDGAWLLGTLCTTDTADEVIGRMDNAADGDEWTRHWTYFVAVQHGEIATATETQ